MNEIASQGQLRLAYLRWALVTVPAIVFLGFLSGSNCPHYDGEVERRPAYHRMLESGMLGGYAADDGVGLHFINGSLRHVVSSRLEGKGSGLRQSRI